MASRDPEEWTEQDLDSLLGRIWGNLDEALACRWLLGWCAAGSGVPGDAA